MRLIDADKLKRKVQRIATEAWKMKLTANIETTLNQFIDYVNEAPTIEMPTWTPCNERMPENSGDYLVRPSDSVLEDYSDFSEVMIMPYDADCDCFGWWIV